MPTEPRFTIEKAAQPREYLGTVYLGEKCVMRRIVVARDNAKALSRIQGMYQSLNLQKASQDEEE